MTYILLILIIIGIIVIIINQNTHKELISSKDLKKENEDYFIQGEGYSLDIYKKVKQFYLDQYSPDGQVNIQDYYQYKIEDGIVYIKLLERKDDSIQYINDEYYLVQDGIILENNILEKETKNSREKDKTKLKKNIGETINNLKKLIERHIIQDYEIKYHIINSNK